MKTSHLAAILGGVLLLSVPIVVVVIWYQMTPRSLGRGAAYETKSFEDRKVIFRTTAYHEKVSGLALPGSFLVFEGRPRSSGTWTLLFEWSRDDPSSIPEPHVRFVTDDLAFLFTDTRLAVTSDGGQTWSTWDAAGTYFARIHQVTLSIDGTGSLVLQPYRDDTRKVILRTSDSGRHWSP